MQQVFDIMSSIKIFAVNDTTAYKDVQTEDDMYADIAEGYVCTV